MTNVKDWICLVEEELSSIFSGLLDLPAGNMYEMMQYHLGWRDEKLQLLSFRRGGKYLRPMLCLLSHYAVSNSIDQAIPLAASIELQHNSTLILDDVEDGDEIRRGQPAVWKLYGIPHGVNTGDAMSDLATLALWRLIKYNIPHSVLLSIIQKSLSIALEIREGQYMDIAFEKKVNVTTDEYMCMIGKKTGALIEFSTYGGAYLATQDMSITEAFRLFGRKLGIAMQIRDDLMGIWGEGKESGKYEAADLRKKKKTLPVIYCLEHLQGKQRDKFIKIYGKSGLMREDEIVWILELLDEVNAYEFCYKTAKEYEFALKPLLSNISLSSSNYKDLFEFASVSCDSIGKLRNCMATHQKGCI